MAQPLQSGRKIKIFDRQEVAVCGQAGVTIE
jgi:hypothetical protein